MTICAVEGCSKEVRRRGPYCYPHYMKNWRYGTPTPVHAKFRKDLTGERFGKLVVLEHAGSGMWKCVCDCGVEVVKRTGDLNRTEKPTCSVGSLCRRADVTSYSGAHDRIRRDRGSASEYDCVDCGRQASQWSYNHSDFDELYSAEKASFGLPFSLDVGNYDPRCIPCHKRFDIDRLGGKIARKSTKTAGQQSA